jgi:POT family proton-dependent oligopeptide transporter
VFGGLIADKLLGQRLTVVIGAVIMSAGHIIMASEAGFLIAILLLIIGTGLLKGNISTQVGHLYAPEDEGRRTRAFAIFSAAINVGAMTGPLVCGILAQAYGWHVGFGAAGLLMLIALATYLAGAKYLPPDRKRGTASIEHAPLTGHDWRVIIVLLVIAAIGIPPATAYYQETNSGLLFIEYSVDRTFFGWDIPTPSFNALDGFFCILFVPPLIAYWAGQAKRGREPGDMSKVMIGYLLTALANLLIIWPAMRADAGETVSVIWPIALFALNALGFLFYWPTLLALFSRTAPPQVNGTMMGMLFFSTFIGNLLGGTLGGLWERMSHANFFLLHALLALGPALVMLLVARPFGRLLRPPTQG